MSTSFDENDMLKLRENVDCQKMLAKMSDNPSSESIVLSLQLIKINKRGKEQNRLLLLTNQALYNIKPGQLKKCQRRIELSKILCITMSITSHEFAIHVPQEYDIRYKSKYKERIASLLSELLQKSDKKLVINKTKEENLSHIIITKEVARTQTQQQRLRRGQSLINKEDEIYDIQPYNSFKTNSLKVKNNLNWSHISNAIEHFLYDKIALSFMNIMKKENNKTITSILTKLQSEKKISQNEIDYLREIINRTIRFQPITNANKAQNIRHTCNQNKSNDFDLFVGLNINMLYDIYNVYNCFLFSNYQFTKYKKDTFVKDIETNNYFDRTPKHAHIAIKIKESINNHAIPQIDLFPQYIIDDDMYDIWTYFFAASHFIHKLIQTNSKNIVNNGNFIFKICIIPNRIISVCDENIIFPYDVNGIDDYIKSKQILLSQRLTISSTKSDISTISDIFQMQLTEIKAKIADHEIRNLLIIIDRRPTSQININKLYMITSNDSLSKLHELDENYFISLQFRILQKNIVRCHLFYGLGNMYRMMFY
eukprot:454970_1